MPPHISPSISHFVHKDPTADSRFSPQFHAPNSRTFWKCGEWQAVVMAAADALQPLLVQTLCSHLPPPPPMNKMGRRNGGGTPWEPQDSPRISSREGSGVQTCLRPLGSPTCHPSLPSGASLGWVHQAPPSLRCYSFRPQIPWCFARISFIKPSPPPEETTREKQM